MKAMFLFIAGCCWAGLAIAQIDTVNLEIWGLPAGQSKTSFVQTLVEKKGTVCMAKIRPLLGYKSANVIGMDNIMLVTLREEPVDPLRKTAYVTDLSGAMTRFKEAQIENCYSKEGDLAIKNFFANQQNDTAFVQGNLRRVGKYDTSAYTRITHSLQQRKALSGNDCLSLMYHGDSSLVKDKALLGYLGYIQNNDDALQLLPMLLDEDIDLSVMNVLKGYFRYHQLTEADWEKYHTEMIAALNTPDPPVFMNWSQMLIKQGIPSKYVPEIYKNGMTAINEINAGVHPDIQFYKEKTKAFTDYLLSL